MASGTQARAIEVIKANNGRITLPALTAQMGTDRMRALQALKALMKRYRCNLLVTDDGDIIYDFGRSFRAVEPFVSLVITYVAAFFIMLWRLVESGILYVVWSIVGSIGRITPIVGLIFLGPGGYILGKLMENDIAALDLDELRKRLKKHKDNPDDTDTLFNLVGMATPQPTRRVWEFSMPDPDISKKHLFGSRLKAEFDNLKHWHKPKHHQDRLFMAYVNRVGGLVTPMEWAMLFDTDLQDAEDRITKLYAEYDADVKVSDTGELVFDFTRALGKDYGIEPAPRFYEMIFRRQVVGASTRLPLYSYVLLTLFGYTVFGFMFAGAFLFHHINLDLGSTWNTIVLGIVIFNLISQFFLNENFRLLSFAFMLLIPLAVAMVFGIFGVDLLKDPDLPLFSLGGFLALWYGGASLGFFYMLFKVFGLVVLFSRRNLWFRMAMHGYLVTHDYRIPADRKEAAEELNKLTAFRVHVPSNKGFTRAIAALGGELAAPQDPQAPAFFVFNRLKAQQAAVGTIEPEQAPGEQKVVYESGDTDTDATAPTHAYGKKIAAGIVAGVVVISMFGSIAFGALMLKQNIVEYRRMKKEARAAEKRYKRVCPFCKKYEKLCKDGDGKSCMFWAHDLIHLDVKRDREKAFKYSCQACGNLDANGCDGCDYLFQKIHPHDRGIARRLCNQGVPAMCNRLGILMEIGKGGPKNPKGALAMYKKTCDMGESVGCYNLALSLAKGDGVPKDLKRAWLYFSKACRMGYQDACDEMKSLAEGKAADASLAETLCDTGDADACNKLGGILKQQGSQSHAIQAYAKGCDLGDTESCLHAAELLGSGRDVKHLKTALLYYGRACASEDSELCSKRKDFIAHHRSAIIQWCNSLGADLCLGVARGLKTDFPGLAVKAYRRSCKLGDPKGCYLLGGMLEGKRNMARKKEAWKAYLKACRDEYKDACDKFGDMLGNLPDRRLAKVLCHQGKAYACTIMGLMWQLGKGGPENHGKARAFFKQACNMDFGQGCMLLGNSLKGDKAWMYLSRACELGVDEACERILDMGKTVGKGRKVAQLLCEQGKVRYCYELGRMMENGKGGQKDMAGAMAGYDLGCRQGHLTSCVKLADYLVKQGEGSGEMKYLVRAAKLYERACKQDSGSGCKQLSSLSKDKKYSRTLDNNLCKQGDAFACNELGVLMLQGKYGPRDIKGAFDRLKEACRLGLGMGCFNAGIALDTDSNADDGKVLAFYMKACEKGVEDGCKKIDSAIDTAGTNHVFSRICTEGGYGPGCRRLGLSLTGSTDSESSSEGPVTWFQRACDLKDPDGCYYLARYIQSNSTDGPGLARARRIYKKACDMGSAKACFSLGWMMEYGVGGGRDMQKAVRMYHKACRKGQEDACKAMYFLLRAQKRDRKWAQALCKAGDPELCYKAGWWMSTGQYGHKDIKGALKMYKEACAEKHGKGCFQAARIVQASGGPGAMKAAWNLYVRAWKYKYKPAIVAAFKLLESGKAGVTLATGLCKKGDGLACSELAWRKYNRMALTNASMAVYGKHCSLGRAIGHKNVLCR